MSLSHGTLLSCTCTLSYGHYLPLPALGFGALLADLGLLLMKNFSLASTVLLYAGKYYNQGIATHFFSVHLGWIYSRSALEQLKFLSSVRTAELKTTGVCVQLDLLCRS